MSPKERIEEAHGLWELTMVRLAAAVEFGVQHPLLGGLVDEERRAFAHWQAVSAEAVRA